MYVLLKGYSKGPRAALVALGPFFMEMGKSHLFGSAQ